MEFEVIALCMQSASQTAAFFVSTFLRLQLDEFGAFIT
jgi:hypothetical protein